MNVLFITADQHLATCLGHEGHPQVLTPHLDQFAAGALRFSNTYTQSPICTPSRVSFYSGQYCHNHGYYGLIGPAPARLPSFFAHFKAHGYRTAGIGTLHTPNDPRDWLANYLDAYDETFSSRDGRHYATAWYDEIRRRGLLEKEDFYIFDGNGELGFEGQPSALPFELSQEGWCVQSAVRFMDACGGQPFCMHVSLERPHQPFYPAQQFWEMYSDDLALPPTINQDPSGRPPHFQAGYTAFHSRRWQTDPADWTAGARRMWRAYLACITHVDHAVGLLLEHLERAGLAASTIVIYTADHGSYSGTHGILEKAPGICSQAVCRVPSLWRVPGVTPTNHRCDQLTQLIDIAPTLAAQCGLPAMDTVDGCDISGLLAGGDKPVHEVVVTEHPWSKSLRWRQWRFVHYQREMFSGQDVGELYDIAADPDETHNLYHDAAHREIVEQCRRLVLEWLIRTTRVKTVWPALDYRTPPYDYRTAGDGKEANTAGPALRLRRGNCDYL